MTEVEKYLAEVKQRVEAATPGEWQIHLRNPFSIECEVGILNSTGGTLFRSTSYGKMRDDGYFIRAARTDVPKLIAMVECAEGILHRKGFHSCDLSGDTDGCTACRTLTELNRIASEGG